MDELDQPGQRSRVSMLEEIIKTLEIEEQAKNAGDPVQEEDEVPVGDEIAEAIVEKQEEDHVEQSPENESQNQDDDDKALVETTDDTMEQAVAKREKENAKFKKTFKRQMVVIGVMSIILILLLATRGKEILFKYLGM